MAEIHLPAIIAVAGVSFRQEELRSVVEGDVVTLVADDENPHDQNAVTVIAPDGAVLGFVPRQLAPRLRATGAATWPAKVREILRHDTWGLRIEVFPTGTELSSPRDLLAAATARGTRTAPPETLPSDLPPAPQARRRSVVVAPSGRVLGSFVRDDGDRVVVVKDGVEVSFPRSSVTLKDA
jgi:hypothetical protein